MGVTAVAAAAAGGVARCRRQIRFSVFCSRSVDAAAIVECVATPPPIELQTLAPTDTDAPGVVKTTNGVA